jgi:hypothetical protein
LISNGSSEIVAEGVRSPQSQREHRPARPESPGDSASIEISSSIGAAANTCIDARLHVQQLCDPSRSSAVAAEDQRSG